jgi:hypothetical protein
MTFLRNVILLEIVVLFGLPTQPVPKLLAQHALTRVGRGVQRVSMLSL